MDGGQNQVILIAQGVVAPAAGRIGWVERQRADQIGKLAKPGAQRAEHIEIGHSRLRVIVAIGNDQRQPSRQLA